MKPNAGNLYLLDAGKVLATMRSSDANDVDMAVNSARDAFRSWSQLSGMQRGKLLTKAAQILRVSLLTVCFKTCCLALCSFKACSCHPVKLGHS